jgi:hypothetical protein
VLIAVEGGGMAETGEDCHFFMTTGCTKGAECGFRHSSAAKDNEKVRKQKTKGRAFKPVWLKKRKKKKKKKKKKIEEKFTHLQVCCGASEGGRSI